jgi:hypothetical protein
VSVTLSVVRNQVRSLLNASSTYGTDDSDLFNDSELDEAILERDAQICQAILETHDHPHLKAFTTSTASSVATGTDLVDHVGPIFDIKRTLTDASVVQAVLVPYEKLIRWQRNAGGLYVTVNLKERYAALFGGAIYFAGGGSVAYKYRAFTKGAACQAPDEYTGMEVRGGLGDAYGKEALSETLAQHYNTQFDKDIEAIRRRMPPAPMEIAA